ncbi:MAG: peptidoglycan DD-metalloendopeptidase family protein [Dethiobacteria bacterium]|nr:peptidoglycan DD-metalloendopeptidase family protein [Bacillota bacterium]HPT33100.1 peptidoglycan DD-metalloendopeptidase family protein [Bacillota bacterium]HPZ64353.1 peptidoglycan DD-metalloendopeptidase family protein [Bacillota bacterium]
MGADDIKGWKKRVALWWAHFLGYRKIKGFWQRMRSISFSKPLYLAMGILLISGALAYAHHQESFLFVVRLDGKEIGLVEDPGPVEAYVSLLAEQCSEIYGMAVVPQEEITVRREYRPQARPDAAGVEEALRRQITMVTEAVMLTVDNVPVAPVAHRGEIDAVADLILDAYRPKDDRRKIVDICLVQELDGFPVTVLPGQVQPAQEVADLLLCGGERKETYTVAALASRHSLEVEDSLAVNLGLPKAPAGGEAIESMAVPKLEVKIVEEVVAQEQIPFSTHYIYNDNMWSVHSRIKTPGRPGKKEVLYQVTRINGVETGRRRLSERVLEAPVTQVVERGTAAVPSRGSGQFIWPVKGGGVITQGFKGWGHAGIDISYSSWDQRHNTQILAADSGVVVQTGSQWRQGNYIIIYHGKYFTVYLHNRKNLVSVGQTVSKGQVIAIMGNTGKTEGIDGIHLHFEIRVNDGSGVWRYWRQHPAVDPLRFFNP